MYPTTLFILAILLGLAVMSLVCWGFRNAKESALPIAVFRIGFCFVLFMEVNELRQIRHLVFDEIPYYSAKVIDLEWMFVIWLVVIVLMGVGFCFRYAACINFAFSVATFGSFHHFEYHMDHAYMAVGFMFLILPVAKVLSVDRVIERMRYGDMTAQPLVDGLCTKLLLFAGVGLVYFDSIFWKMQSEFWTRGLGTWIPGSISSVVVANHSFLLDQSWLMYAMGYFTVIFELVFVFTFWSRWFRWPLFITGLGLHIGILVFFPIPWFALGVIGMYVLLIPGSFWSSIGRFFQRRQPKYTVRYDDSDPSTLRTVVFLDILDWFNVLGFESLASEQSVSESPRLMFTDLNGDEHSGLAAVKMLKDLTVLGKVVPQRCMVWVVQKFSVFQITPTPEWRTFTRLAIGFCLFIFVATQSVATYKAPGFAWFFDPSKSNQPTLINSVYEATGVASLLRTKESFSLYGKTTRDTRFVVQIARTLFGVSYHGVFMDYHFDGLDHIVTVAHIDEDGSETFLPLYQPDGMAGPINSGRIWVYWTFRVAGRDVHSKNVAAGVEQITAFWCHENGIPLEGAKFRIKVKSVEKINLTQWSEGFLERQLQQPWVDAGTAQWEDKTMSIELEDIESMQPDPRFIEK